ncbi:hypothetical protein BX070DRAFT_255047 [Coemansia spiralis]|nr:hypothetical protein BX070DRAFT_255047 [Coemansia spiralis]
MDTAMIELSSRIRSQPSWTSDKDLPEKRRIWHKWGKELGLCNDEITFALDELEYYASVNKPEHGIEIGCYDMVWTSTSLTGDNLRMELIEQLELFKQHPQIKKNIKFYWHGYSATNSLWLFRRISNMLDFNRTRIHEGMQMQSPEDALKYLGCGKRPESKEVWERIYKKYDSDVSISWNYMGGSGKWNRKSILPSEVHVDIDGNANFITYINNIHPVWHRQLYTTIEKTLTAMIPLFEEVLTDIAYPLRMRTFSDFSYGKDVRPKVPEAVEFSDKFISEYTDWYHKTRFVPRPRGKFTMPNRPNTSFSLCGQRLQVVVKAVEYPIPAIETSDTDAQHIWLHDESRIENESTIATAIYYYSMDNIATAKQGFSLYYDDSYWAYSHDFDHMPDIVFGPGGYDDDLYDRASINTDLIPPRSFGSQLIKEGTSVCYSACYDSDSVKVELADPTKPGAIKALIFYLFNPSRRRISTEIVPPQQVDWWIDKVFRLSCFEKLPWLIVERIKHFIINYQTPRTSFLVPESFEICSNGDWPEDALNSTWEDALNDGDWAEGSTLNDV